jgi:hypothetical protein
MWNLLAELIKWKDEWSYCETINGLHVKLVKHIQLANALLKHIQYIYQINVKLRSSTGTVAGCNGSYLKHHPMLCMYYWNIAIQIGTNVKHACRIDTI